VLQIEASDNSPLWPPNGSAEDDGRFAEGLARPPAL
jgi:hypothetical protein